MIEKKIARRRGWRITLFSLFFFVVSWEFFISSFMVAGSPSASPWYAATIIVLAGLVPLSILVMTPLVWWYYHTNRFEKMQKIQHLPLYFAALFIGYETILQYLQFMGMAILKMAGIIN